MMRLKGTDVLISALMLFAGVAHAQTFTATRDPVVSTTFRLAWDVPGAAACVAGKTTGWNGPIPTSGTRTLTSVAVSMTLTLDCTGPDGNGVVLVSWTPPTTNTDGTPLTNLGGYRIFYSRDQTLSQAVDINVPAATAYTLADLPPGTYSVAVSALTTQCFPNPQAVTCRISGQSNIASKAVGTPGPALPQLSVVLEPFPTPSPPTNVLASDPQVYDVRPSSTGALVATRVGLIAPGTQCGDETRRVGSVTYTRVPREKVDIVNWGSGKTYVPDVWAKCG